MEADWELSQQLISDSQGIRAATPLETATTTSSTNDKTLYQVVTGNQGGGLCAFGIEQQQQSSSFSIHPIEYQHNDAVTALLSFSTPSATPGTSSRTYATGCKDAKIRIFSKDHQLLTTLEGHEKPVTSLAHTENFLISGSWDGTAKLWKLSTNAMVATLPNHENSVCVTALFMTTSKEEDGVVTVATGSAGIAQQGSIVGHTTRIWKVTVSTGQVQLLHSFANDHEGPIRDICTIHNSNSTLLATCSNDGTVKLRDASTGTVLSTLSFLSQQTQHPPMLLSVTAVLDSDGGCSLAAAAEDGHVVVWDLQSSLEDNNNSTAVEPQILLHPACVWQVVALPNGDLATCCQDGNLRIFTRDLTRMAPQTERDAFSDAVQAAHAKRSSGPSAEEIAKLPLWEQNLQHRGTSEGQVQIFNKGGIAIAAQWSAASQTWIEVGQVMGSSSEEDGRGNIDGVMYDHVLPIEVDQVTEAGQGVAKLQIGVNTGENPFVAAQRFIDQHMLPQHHLNDIAQYIEQRTGRGPTTLGGTTAAAAAGTTANSTSPVATTGIPMVQYDYLPMKSYLDLSAKSVATIMEKMKPKLIEGGNLSEAQLADLSTLMDTLGKTNAYHSSKVTSNSLKVIETMVDQLPPAAVFPALDLARLAACHPDACSETTAAFWEAVIGRALILCGDTMDSSLTGTAATAVPMLSLRLFANAFRGGPGSRQAVVTRMNDIVLCTAKFRPSSNKNIRLGVATIWYNIVYFLHSSKIPRLDVALTAVTEIDEILKSRSYEADATTRVLVALGSLVITSAEAKQAAKAQFVTSRVEIAASPHGEVARTVAKEVYNVLQ